MAAQYGEEFDLGVRSDPVEGHLAAGRFRLIVAVDAINVGPKRTLVFPNTHSTLPVQPGYRIVPHRHDRRGAGWQPVTPLDGL